MALPNFLIVGTAKSGTTSLYYYLKQHPDIYMPETIKETFFFSGITPEMFPGIGHEYAESAITTLEQYSQLFENVKTEKAIGEACVAYLYYYQTSIKRILELLGKETKIIISLRDPIDRAYSNYQHHLRENWEPLSFLEAIKAESWRKEQGWWWGFDYLPVSYYYEQVKAYLDVFGRENTLIILYDDLLKNQQKIMKNIFLFLEVDDTFNPDLSEKRNVSKVAKSRKLQDLIYQESLLKSIFKGVVPSLIRKPLSNKLKKINTVESPKLSLKERQQLLPLYQEDISKLQDLIQRDLSHWLR